MLGIILAVTLIPSYLFISGLVARFIYLKLKEKNHFDPDGPAIIIGVFWPLIFPFWLGFNLRTKTERLRDREAKRIKAIRDAEKDLEEATRTLIGHITERPVESRQFKNLKGNPFD
jgi:hypothetical protein